MLAVLIKGWRYMTTFGAVGVDASDSASFKVRVSVSAFVDSRSGGGGLFCCWRWQDRPIHGRQHPLDSRLKVKESMLNGFWVDEESSWIILTEGAYSVFLTKGAMTLVPERHFIPKPAHCTEAWLKR